MISYLISSLLESYTQSSGLRLRVVMVSLIVFSTMSYWLLYENEPDSPSPPSGRISNAFEAARNHWVRLVNYVGSVDVGKVTNSSKSYTNIAGDEKLILMYSRWYVGMNPIWSANFSTCPFKCRATANKNDLNRSHAVIFSPISLNQHHIKIPPRGPALQNQIRIVGLLEPPGLWTTSHKMSVYDNQFNWTFTYRRDSDLPLPANRLEALKPNQGPVHVIPTVASIKGKRLVAAMINRCRAPSQREKYIAEFRKFAPLDHYGRCGNLTCKVGINCYPILAKKYKFWLSFENSLCKEYVTEKFFEPMLNGMVPVVYGSGPYAEIAPNGSYIDVRDFESPAALAKYLLYLDKHPEEYLKYFSWMKHFSLVHSTWNYRLGTGFLPEGIPDFWCNLCKKLHRTDLIKDRKWYSKFDAWLRYNNTNSSMCTKPVFPVKRNKQRRNM